MGIFCLCCFSTSFLSASPYLLIFFFFSSRRRHTRCLSDWSSDVCSSDLRGRASRPWPAPGAHSRQPSPCSSRRSHRARPPHRRVGRRAAPGAATRAPRRQIGRASCRERVERSVGGGVVEKRERERVGDEP